MIFPTFCDHHLSSRSHHDPVHSPHHPALSPCFHPLTLVKLLSNQDPLRGEIKRLGRNATDAIHWFRNSNASTFQPPKLGTNHNTNSELHASEKNEGERTRPPRTPKKLPWSLPSNASPDISQFSNQRHYEGEAKASGRPVPLSRPRCVWIYKTGCLDLMTSSESQPQPQPDGLKTSSLFLFFTTVAAAALLLRQTSGDIFRHPSLSVSPSW